MRFLVLFVVLILVVNGLEQEEVSPRNNERAVTTWSDPAIQALYSPQTGGEGTYYGAYTGGGACTLDPTPPLATTSAFYATVAIADNIWANSQACGLCIEVTPTGAGSGANPLPTGPLLVFVNNECPSCANNGLDFGLNGDGAWGITWQVVDCPVGSGSSEQFISYYFQGTNAYYTKIQIRNTRVPAYAVSILSGGSWVALTRTADNFFTFGDGSGLTNPFSIQLTSVAGDVVTDTLSWVANGAAAGSGVQFPASSGVSTATTSTATTAKATTTTTTGTTAKATTTTASTATTAKGTTTTGSATTAKSTTTTTTGSSGITETLQIVVNSGTNKNWLGINGPISGAYGTTQNVQISISSAWVNMTVVSYGWTYSAPGAGLTLPISLRITTTNRYAAVLNGVITSLTPTTYVGVAATYLPY